MVEVMGGGVAYFLVILLPFSKIFESCFQSILELFLHLEGPNLGLVSPLKSFYDHQIEVF